MKNLTWYCLTVYVLFYNVLQTSSDRSGITKTRGHRKLFGGYRITPKFCKATRTVENPPGGPNICMFNHECVLRKGQVVGACMDGFLFGSCCQLPKGETIGDFLAEGHPMVQSGGMSPTTHRTTPEVVDITSHGVSQIAASLLAGGPPFSGGSNSLDNEISSTNYPTKKTTLYEEEQTTVRYADTYPHQPVLQISVSNAPLGYTPIPTIQRPMFRPKPPKPTDEGFVLIPTLTHVTTLPNRTEDSGLQSSTNGPLYTFSYVSSSTTSSRKPERTTQKPPSTSYVFSTTIPPRRTKPTKSRKPVKKTSRPTSSTSYSSTFRPSTLAHSTLANSPEAFSVSQTTPSVVSSSIAGPGFTVVSQPVGGYSPFPSPAPTLIVLGPVENDLSTQGYASSPTTSRPVPQLPQRKPINHVTINNHVTQNIYSTQRPQTSSLPSPTVIITPKPTISSSLSTSLAEEDLESVVVTSPNDLINFPPDRNPNLNISHPALTDQDITTPSFVEDDALNEKVESFVNEIIYGLQEPFNDLKDIVSDSNTRLNVSDSSTTTRKPSKGTTKKPVTLKTTTRRPPTTRRPLSTTKRPSASTKRPSATTKRAPTTTANLIETESEIHQNYRDQCGVRPLVKSGRIVGGRGAVFGEFPWQVLVRESTWLGLFTKNKCGGVLIGDKYVMTAAHCQPGFLASLVAVFGEYDISGDLETRKPVSRNVKRVIVHRKYDAATFENDLAILELESPVTFDAHIIPICLPQDNADYTKRMATVTGWGRLRYGGGIPSVLQEVQVPIMENHVCQDMFRTAGHSKVILESFLCAGYANGQKDACEGDSGGPLVVQRPDGRYELAGTVSHGIKCAAPYLPGVYMRTTYYKSWITSITGLD